LLQRAIANAKGISPHIPLNITPILNNKDLTDYAPQPFQPPQPPTQQHQMHQPAPPPPAQPPPGQRLHVTNPSFPAPSTSIQSKPTNDIHMSTSSHLNTSSPSSAASYIPNDYSPSAGTMIHNTASGMSSTEEEAVTSDNVHRLWKRKYHRHAKPDINAPLKPPSAYVMFSNDVRAELKQQNKSFTDLAKIIGDRWKNITPAEKEMYETIALKAREEYLKKIEEYQKTDAFKKYQQYISDFKAENEAAARPVGRPRKRHRRDEYGSDGTVSDSARPRRTSSICSQTEEAVNISRTCEFNPGTRICPQLEQERRSVAEVNSYSVNVF
ncbi:hypothetical protein CU098_000646, partial [Rhizopus stolonifer]